MLRSLTFLAILFATNVGFGADNKPLPGKTVHMAVTEKGFEPGDVRAKKGEQLNLIITRTVENTCATEVTLDEYAIKKKLPLNQPVTVSFIPQKSGKLKYGCGMNKMVGGVILVE